MLKLTLSAIFSARIHSKIEGVMSVRALFFITNFNEKIIIYYQTSSLPEAYPLLSCYTSYELIHSCVNGHFSHLLIAAIQLTTLGSGVNKDNDVKIIY